MQSLKKCELPRKQASVTAGTVTCSVVCARDFRAIIPCLACRECIPSGALTLDIALGGGFPKGRIIEVGSPACNLLVSLIMLSCLVGHLIVCTYVLLLFQCS